MNSKIQRVLGGALLCACAGQANAAGFAIIEHGAQGMGNAFAGGGAVAEDASTVWFNPASMSRLGSQFQASGHIIRPSFTFTNTGSTAAGTGRPLLSGFGGSTPAPQSDDGGKTALVPNLYYIHKLDERFSFGLAINAPFGLATEYDDDWIGRYQAIESEIINLNVNPAIAYKVNSNLSVGAGLNINYIDAKLTKAIDFTGACLNAAAGALAQASTCVGVGNGPGQAGNDGFGQVRGDDVSFGFNLGLMYEVNEYSRVALAFRSEIKHGLEGQAKFTVPTVVNSGMSALAIGQNAAVRGAFAADSVSARLRLPASFSISGYHRFNGSRLAVMADATWTGWSSVPGVLFIYGRPTTTGGPTDLPLGFEDTWRLGLGFTYYHNEHLTLRTGLAWDQSPTPSAQLRSARLPDSDRTWLSIGGSYKINDRMSADVGYAHLFVDSTTINRTDATSGTLKGNYKSDVDLFSLQFNYQFD